METTALDLLFEDLSHPNPYIQTEAFLAMARDWPDQALPRLLDLLDQDDVNLRRASVRAIGAFGAAAVLPLSQRLQGSDDSTTRASCVKAFAQLASNFPDLPLPAMAMEALRQALDDSSPVVNVATVMALGQIGRQAVDLLLSVARGDNPAQAVAAVNALAQIDDPAVRQQLELMQANPTLDRYVQETLQSALARCGGGGLSQAPVS